MSEQGYTNWTTCVIEHIVRLGEIRIAHALNNSVRADQIRNEYVKKRQFIYIPFLEKSIQTYEKNRDKYKSFEDYFPELLKVFQNIDVSNIK